MLYDLQHPLDRRLAHALGRIVHRDRRALAHLARDVELAAMQLGELSCKRKAHAKPARRAHNCAALAKRLKNTGELFGRDTNAVVCNTQYRTAAFARASQCMSTLPATMSPVTEPMPRFDPAATTVPE